MSETLTIPAATDGKAHLIPDPDLRTIRKALETERDDLIDLEENFKHHALGRFLRIGLQVLKAHAVFAVGDAAERGAMGGRGKTSSTVDELSEPASFEGWLASEVPWLAKATAYRYKRAAIGLGVTHESDPSDVDCLLTQARQQSEKPLSLTLLANRVALALPEPTEEQDPNTPEDKAGEARTQVDDWISRWDRFVKVGGIEVADKQTLQTLHEFHTAERDKIAARLKSAR